MGDEWEGTVRDMVMRETILHPDARIHPLASVGNTPEWWGKTLRWPVCVDEGATIRAFVTVDAGVERHTKIGAGSLLMAHVHVGHDVVIGEGCRLAPHASVGGCVTIGSGVKVGMNASIRPHVTIGDDAVIGQGAVVVKDVPAGEVWAGNPARRVG